MTYIPKLALELQSFSSVEELNHHMALHYRACQHELTKSAAAVFELIKQYSCKIAGVCWLKQENLSEFAHVSLKTVERAIHFLKEKGILKIYHTKRNNGLNGNCYYVLQPFQGEIVIDDEEIVSVEEQNVGAGESGETVDTFGLGEGEKGDKLFLNSAQALESSIKTMKTEEIINSARVDSLKEEEQQVLIRYLTKYSQFSEKHSKQIVQRLTETLKGKKPSAIQSAIAKAEFKVEKRLRYAKPIHSQVDYFVQLVVESVGVKREAGDGSLLPN